eukprot:COSAG06_NODE_31872_length_514_cov_1.267470_1_plen_118_part_10
MQAVNDLTDFIQSLFVEKLSGVLAELRAKVGGINSAIMDDILEQAIASASKIGRGVATVSTVQAEEEQLERIDRMFNDLTDILEAYALEMEVCSEAESQMERYLRKSEASDLDEWAAI